MSFIADLHIHSRFSRATSKKLTPGHLAAWAMVKGLHVLGTGDFTHPAWRAELAEALVRDEETGLYRLRGAPDLSEALPGLDALDARPPLFLWQTEISSIYKRHGKVRRVHNLVYMPDLDAVERLSKRLEGIGNLASDGRPILGLDSRNLVEIVLETDPRGVVIPAHAWTPWFAVFGSKSGFDSMEECFGDLTGEIFALETGLSSDPDMNRMWSHLDHYAMLSNSDAHSGENLGREANRFSGAPSYDGIFDALRRPSARDAACAYAGTVEFFPEEGKYHLDGHRACGVVMDPREALAQGNICPVCGKPLTIGVLHRVLELADRSEPLPPQQLSEPGFSSLIPLPELLGELLGTGSKSRKVAERYKSLLRAFGPEMEILHSVEVDALRRHWEALGEGIDRMRRGQVIREGGFDGEYGTVRVFTPQELAEFASGRGRAVLPGLGGLNDNVPKPKTPRGRQKDVEGSLLSACAPPAGEDGNAVSSGRRGGPEGFNPSGGVWGSAPTGLGASPRQDSDRGAEFSPEQRRAIEAGLGHPPCPVLVAAGPGAGKTRTLVGRVRHLTSLGVPAERILAVTFTRRAAAELKERLASPAFAASGAPSSPDAPRSSGPAKATPACDTLHALAFDLLRQDMETPPVLLSEESARRVFSEANPDLDAAARRAAWDALQAARERLETPAPDQTACLERYAARKTELGVADYTDLLEFWLRRLREAPDTPRRWDHLLVDETQDLSPLQLAVLRGLLPGDGAGFFGIGDPDQAIYSFRGAEADVTAALRGFWPDLRVLRLHESYRAVSGVLDCANTLLAGQARCGRLASRRSGPATLHLFSAPTAEAEAQWIATQIRRLLGSMSHTLADAARRRRGGRQDALGHLEESSCTPGDIAVLVRLKAQTGPLRRALEAQGVPCSVPEEEGCWHDPGVALLLAEAERRLGILDGPLPDADQLIRERLGATDVPAGDAAARTRETDALLAACPADIWESGPARLSAGLPPKAPFDALFWKSAALRELQRLWSAAGGWSALLTQIRFMQDQEQVRADAEQVQIMTLHASKGLEFRCVFLPGLEDGLLPLQRERLFRPAADAPRPAKAATPDSGDDDACAEERRLLYVGVTRAAEAVFCSHAAQRMLYGTTLRLPPSRFLPALREHCRASALVRHTATRKEQLSLM